MLRAGVEALSTAMLSIDSKPQKYVAIYSCKQAITNPTAIGFKIYTFKKI
jgi:hypothetical protein